MSKLPEINRACDVQSKKTAQVKAHLHVTSYRQRQSKLKLKI